MLYTKTESGHSYWMYTDEEGSPYLVIKKELAGAGSLCLVIDEAQYYNALVKKVRVGTNGYIVVKTSDQVIVLHPSRVQWGIGVGSTAVSLATADAATTRAPRRQTLGFHTFAVGAGIGASGGIGIDHWFPAPLLVESGTFFHVICKVPVGTATASQQIRGTVVVDSHWE